MSFVRDAIVRFARQFVQTPYLWGGAGPNQDGTFGFDCSGFVIFHLKPFSLLPERGDWTAQQLSRMFRSTSNPEPGDLIFYGRDDDHVRHVMVYLGNSELGALCVGAAGGGSKTKTVAVALAAKAAVKVLPVGYRKDFLGYRNILAAVEPSPAKTNGGPKR